MAVEEQLMDKDVDSARVEIGKVNAKITNGISLVSMEIRDGDTDKQMWSHKWDSNSPAFAGKLTEAKIPKQILKCKRVKRELCFHSVEKITELKIVQEVYVKDHKVEEFFFEIGFVIPNTTNTWCSDIQADPNMIPVEVLSGNLVVKTTFFDGYNVIGTASVLVYYV